LLQLGVGCAISAVAVYYLLQQVALEQLGQVLAHTQPLAIALLVVSVIGSLLTRAARWQVYFRPHHRVPFGPAFGTLSISYMASTFLPFRAGELIRALFLGQRQNLAVPRVVGTILLEKLFDFLAIGVMLVVLVLVVPLPSAALAAGVSIASVILVGFGFVVALAVWRVPTLTVVERVEGMLPPGVGQRLKLGHAARQFAQGTDSLREGGLWAQLLLWTTLTWIFSLVSGWAGTQAVGINAGLAVLLFLTVITSTGQAVPSSPGYVGVYHAAATFALTSFGFDPTLALGAAVLTHAFSYGPLVIVGLFALWTGGYSLNDLLVGVRRPAAAASS
jgi:glycosyltransferase 2 family protein